MHTCTCRQRAHKCGKKMIQIFIKDNSSKAHSVFSYQSQSTNCISIAIDTKKNVVITPQP